jgi:hypothetical protein
MWLLATRVNRLVMDRKPKEGYLPVGSYKIQVPVIVNSNTAQVLVVTEIPLSPPAFKIDEIHKVIEIDDSLSDQVGV